MFIAGRPALRASTFRKRIRLANKFKIFITQSFNRSSLKPAYKYAYLANQSSIPARYVGPSAIAVTTKSAPRTARAASEKFRVGRLVTKPPRRAGGQYVPSYPPSRHAIPATTYHADENQTP